MRMTRTGTKGPKAWHTDTALNPADPFMDYTDALVTSPNLPDK